MSDLETGKTAMRYFFEANRRYPGAPQTFEAFYGLYGNKADIYADGIGTAINASSVGDRQVKAAMEGLAAKTQGRIPGDHNAYFAAINGVASQINYLDLATSVTKDVAVQVADGAQALGDNLVSILKIANFVLPFVALYFGYRYLKAKAGKIK